MVFSNLFKHISAAPTNPQPAMEEAKAFDVAELYEGALATEEEETALKALPLDEKLRQAYFWITNNAIISPFYDIEYNDASPRSFTLGDLKAKFTFPTAQCYSSYVLIPLLNLAVRKRCLLVGGPGRGKTAIAILLGVLSGYNLRDIKRAIQHGQPQMTIADLLGNPLPSSLVNAQSNAEIKIAWRNWLGMRVKIIDEYNRIPTRTQSALLTVMGDNYAEMYDQIYECPDAAWYLTANDDAGGGTYQVIEALRDRIDVVVKALHFNTRFLSELLKRIEEGYKPEEIVPPEITFSEAELSQMDKAVRKVSFPRDVLRRLEFFASHFEFYEPAARQIEYMTKDTVKLSGIEFSTLIGKESGKDQVSDLGSQTFNGLSVRSLMTCMSFVKAMAFFRGASSVDLEDLRQILPFVLHDKLSVNMDSAFFEVGENAPLRVDRVSWIRALFDASCQEYDRLDRDRKDPLLALEESFSRGLEGVTADQVERELTTIERTISQWSSGRKFYGHMYDDVLKLKYLHQRYTNYLRWLKWKG